MEYFLIFTSDLIFNELLLEYFAHELIYDVEFSSTRAGANDTFV